MAIPSDFLEYEEKIISNMGLNYRGLEWCELGNQICYGPPTQPAKKMYVAKGVKHTSIDINGKDGALPLSLDTPVPDYLINRFDVVTNYGTVEHVDNQYEAFKNIHRMCKVGGLMIHVFPAIGNWPKHCRYYYSEKFTDSLAGNCQYKMVCTSVLNSKVYKFPKNVIHCVMRKELDTPFISSKEFCKIAGVVDSKFINRTGKNL